MCPNVRCGVVRNRNAASWCAAVRTKCPSCEAHPHCRRARSERTLVKSPKSLRGRERRPVDHTHATSRHRCALDSHPLSRVSSGCVRVPRPCAVVDPQCTTVTHLSRFWIRPEVSRVRLRKTMKHILPIQQNSEPRPLCGFFRGPVSMDCLGEILGVVASCDGLQMKNKFIT